MGSHTIARAAPRRPAVDPSARIALDCIRRIVRALRESSRAAEKKVGLSGAQLFVLSQLASAKALSINELAARTLTHQSSVSVVVQRLVDQGLVEREPSATDARRVEIALTRRGRATLRSAPDAAQDRLIQGILRLSPRRRRTLALSLGSLVRSMAAEAEPPLMFFEEPDQPRRRKKEATHGKP